MALQRAGRAQGDRLAEPFGVCLCVERLNERPLPLLAPARLIIEASWTDYDTEPTHRDLIGRSQHVSWTPPVNVIKAEHGSVSCETGKGSHPPVLQHLNGSALEDPPASQMRE